MPTSPRSVIPLSAASVEASLLMLLPELSASAAIPAQLPVISALRPRPLAVFPVA